MEMPLEERTERKKIRDRSRSFKKTYKSYLATDNVEEKKVYYEYMKKSIESLQRHALILGVMPKIAKSGRNKYNAPAEQALVAIQRSQQFESLLKNL